MSADITVSVDASGAGDVARLDNALDHLYKTLGTAPKYTGLEGLKNQIDQLKQVYSGGSDAVESEAKKLREASQSYINEAKTFRAKLRADGVTDQAELIRRTQAQFAEQRAALTAGYASLREVINTNERMKAEAAAAAAKANMPQTATQQVYGAMREASGNTPFTPYNAIAAYARASKADIRAEFKDDADRVAHVAKIENDILKVRMAATEQAAEIEAQLAAKRIRAATPRLAMADALKEARNTGAEFSPYRPPSAQQVATLESAKAARAEALALKAAQTEQATAAKLATQAQIEHNLALKNFTLGAADAHSAARGLASGFGAMWLTWGSVAPLIAAAAISHSFVQIVKVGADVEHTLATIAELGGNSAQSMEGLNNTLLKMASTGPYGPQEIAKAMKDLSLAGLSANEIIAVLPDVLNFATAGTTDLTTAAKTLVQTTTAFGRGAESFNTFGDMISKTAAVSMSSVESISEAFKSASVANKQYGVSLLDVSTGLASLSQLGIQGSAAGTALRNMYADLSGRSSKTAQILEDYKIQFRDAQGNFLSVLEIAERMTKKLKDLTPVGQKNLIQALLGERGGKEMVEILDLYLNNIGQFSNGAKNALEELRAKIADNAGFMIMTSAVLSQTTEKQMESVKSSLTGAFVESFKAIQPEILATSQALQELFRSDGFKSTVEALATVFSVLTRTLADHAGTLVVLSGIYVSFRLTASLLPGVFTAIEASSLAAAVGVTSLARALQLANRALLVITGLIAAYEFLRDQQATRSAQDKSAEAYLERLKTEAERIEGVNVLLRQNISLKEAQAIQDGQTMSQDKLKRLENANKALSTAEESRSNAAQLDPMFPGAEAIKAQAKAKESSARAERDAAALALRQFNEQESMNRKRVADAVSAQENELTRQADEKAKARRDALGGGTDPFKLFTQGEKNAPFSAQIASLKEGVKEAKVAMGEILDDIDSRFKLGLTLERDKIEEETLARQDFHVAEIVALEKELKLAESKKKSEVEQARILGNLAVAEAAYSRERKKGDEALALFDRKHTLWLINKQLEAEQATRDKRVEEDRAQAELDRSHISDHKASEVAIRQAREANKLYAYELSLAGATKEERELAVDAMKREFDLKQKEYELSEKYGYDVGNKARDGLMQQARELSGTQRQGLVDKLLGDKRQEIVTNLADAIAEGIETGGESGGKALLAYLKKEFIMNPIRMQLVAGINGLTGAGGPLGGFMDTIVRGLTGLGSSTGYIPSASDYANYQSGFSAPTTVSVPGFDNIPPLADGTPYVPQDMLAYIHKGEAVVPAKWNNSDAMGGAQVTNAPTIYIDSRADQGATQALVQGAINQNNVALMKLLRQEGVIA